MKTTILTTIFCLFITLTYSQTKDYYKREGVITSKARSGSKSYNCILRSHNRVALHDVNVKSAVNTRTPTRKKEVGFAGIEPTDPKIYHTIVGNILSKHSIEIFSYDECRERNAKIKLAMKNGVGADCTGIEMFVDAFGLTVTSDENGNILNIEMRFTASGRFGALPIEVYQEIDTELRKKLKVIVTDYGKAACFYCQGVILLVKAPKK